MTDETWRSFIAWKKLLLVAALSAIAAVSLGIIFSHDHMADLVARRPGVALVEIELEAWHAPSGSMKTFRIRDKASLHYIQSHRFGLEDGDERYYSCRFRGVEATFHFENGAQYNGTLLVPNDPTFLVIVYPVNRWSTEAVFDPQYLLELEPSKTEFLHKFFDDLGFYRFDKR